MDPDTNHDACYHPLKVNTATGEVYLQLPAPLSHIIITPPRKEDVDTYLVHLNDPLVWEGLSSVHVPYLREHGETFFGKNIANHERAMNQLKVRNGLCLLARQSG
jgi:hypothetical protein